MYTVRKVVPVHGEIGTWSCEPVRKLLKNVRRTENLQDPMLRDKYPKPQAPCLGGTNEVLV